MIITKDYPDQNFFCPRSDSESIDFDVDTKSWSNCLLTCFWSQKPRDTCCEYLYQTVFCSNCCCILLCFTTRWCCDLFHDMQTPSGVFIWNHPKIHSADGIINKHKYPIPIRGHLIWIQSETMWFGPISDHVIGSSLIITIVLNVWFAEKYVFLWHWVTDNPVCACALLSASAEPQAKSELDCKSWNSALRR